MKTSHTRSLLALLFLAAGGVADASVIVHQTRVVFPSNEQEVSVRLSNNDPVPKLVQAWIDDGDKEQAPAQIDVPFQILTPLFRMDSKKGQVLRIIRLDHALPEDRESVFWLNALEVPPKPEVGEEANYVQFSFRTRIKLFHRPAGLSSDVKDAPKALKWMVDGDQLIVQNPGPYFVSISGAELVGPDGAAGARLVLDMLAP